MEYSVKCDATSCELNCGLWWQ